MYAPSKHVISRIGPQMLLFLPTKAQILASETRTWAHTFWRNETYELYKILAISIWAPQKNSSPMSLFIFSKLDLI